jgi:hypothetical protein
MVDDGLKPLKTIGITSDKVALGIIYPSTINMSPERKMSIKNLKKLKIFCLFSSNRIQKK